jgi:hypothetical protein
MSIFIGSFIVATSDIQIKAYAEVYKALRSGTLTRPHSCSACRRHYTNLPLHGGRYAVIEAHHHRGYAGKAALDVIWLCPECHYAEHATDTAAPENA